MPISRYDIVVATHPKELNALMADGGYVAIGHIYAQPSYGLQAVGEGEIEPWGSVTEYELIQAQFYQDLIPLVNEKIADGYQPIGGLAHWANAFIQAVGKVDASGESGSGSGSGGGNDIEFPEGEPFQVLGFDAGKDLKAMNSGMAQWLGEDRQIGGTAADFIPVVYLTGNGQKVSQGVPNLLALSNSPKSSTVAVRDSGGVLSGGTASRDTELPNLKQVRELIEESKDNEIVISPPGAAYQIMAFGYNGASAEPMPMSMNIWMGVPVTQTGPVECVPTTMFNAGGLLSMPSMRNIDALPTGSSIAFRDANACIGVGDATESFHATNLKQVEDMITERLKTFQDNIIDFINNGGAK